MATATHPTAVSPLRGLDAFGEAERDGFLGRDRQRDELAQLVTSDVFRAGLLYGEAGVGKTSLLRAGLIPYLRAQGVVALASDSTAEPSASLASGLAIFGIQMNPGETASGFLARAVGNAVPGQQFLFVIDDVDRTCRTERGTADLADLFAKVASRAGGRARFLFSCASERMHALAHLERRTGSLFPPSNRIELKRLTVPEATAVFETMISIALGGDLRDIVDQVIAYLASGEEGDGILPADLQIAAFALSARNLTSAEALHRCGGPGELPSIWIHDACAASGNTRNGLRLLAELADGPYRPCDAGALAQRISLPPDATRHTLDTLEARGVVMRCDFGGVEWIIRHQVLVPRIRELTAPTKAAARRAYDLLGSKAAANQRLQLRDLRRLRNEGIAPGTEQERALVAQSWRHYGMIAAIAAAVPVVLLIAIYFSMAGRTYFDLETRTGGEHVIVRDGRPGLSWFHWMGFGGVVADPGLTRSMIAPEAWKRIENRDIGGDDAATVARLTGIMAPKLAALIAYGTSGSDQALERIKKLAKEPEEIVELLEVLRPIGRGGRAETAFVDAAIASSSAAVQRAAIMVAAAAARRRSDLYTDSLTKALAAGNPEVRKIAIAEVRSLPGGRGQRLVAAALEGDIDAATRRELLLEGVPDGGDDGPSTMTAAAILAEPSSSASQRERARGQLRSAMSSERGATAQALADLAKESASSANNESRIFALELLAEFEPLPPAIDLSAVAQSAFASKSEGLRAAALPLFARVAPDRAVAILDELLADKKLGRALKISACKAWGALAEVKPELAKPALETLMRDDTSEVRAAAASAYGKLGRPAQEVLIKMVKNERFDVAVGAALGLAASAEQGASTSVAIDGIAQLWKQKGRPRREAARVFAKLARTRPANALPYLESAARNTEDPSLHPIAMQGLCNAIAAGSPDARRSLTRATDDASVDVRRLVIDCVANGPEPAKNGVAIALRLLKDSDSGIRATAARILAGASSGNKPAGDGLIALSDDAVREVRMVAIRGLASFDRTVSEAATPILLRGFDRGDEGEKLTILRAGKQLGVAEVVAHGMADSSAIVRVASVEASLTAGIAAAETLATALADPQSQVRRAALELIAINKDKIPTESVEKALAVAVRDADPEISQLALTTVARLAAKDAVATRLGRALGSRTERERAQAAAATIGLVDRDAALATQLLEPLLSDPSHDVRVAMLPSLGAAYAKTQTPDRLAALLNNTEKNAMRRLVIASAFIILARTETGEKSAAEALKKIASRGPPLARATAALLLGLLDSKADGIAFMQQLVP